MGGDDDGIEDAMKFDLGAEVAPGWLPLLLVIVLGLTLVGLWFSMRKQMRNITVPVDEDHPEAGPFAKPTP